MERPQEQALEHLRAIRQMMEQARQTVSGQGWPLVVLWGLFGVAASLSNQLMLWQGRIDQGWIPTDILWVLTFAIHLLITRRYGASWGDRRNPMVKVTAALWTALVIGFVIIGLSRGWGFMSLGAMAGVMALLSGIGLFVSAAAFDAPIFYLAGAVWWAGAIVSMARPEVAFLIHAALFIVAFILPGYVLRFRQRGFVASADAAAV